MTVKGTELNYHVDEAALMHQLLKKATKDKKALIMLKNLAVTCKEYELAAQLRNVEVKKFPESEEVKEANKVGVELATAFRMVELNVTPRASWLIGETVKAYAKHKSKFDLEKASKLLAQQEELFDK